MIYQIAQPDRCAFNKRLREACSGSVAVQPLAEPGPERRLGIGLRFPIAVTIGQMARFTHDRFSSYRKPCNSHRAAPPHIRVSA